MLFKNRQEAGKKLAEKLIEYEQSLQSKKLTDENPIVLALPRGGVPVGYEIAKRLNATLDVLVVRKLGAPSNPEYGIGAIAPGNVKVLDQATIKYFGISDEQISQIEKKERAELNRRINEYHNWSSLPKTKDTDSSFLPSLKNRIVILVDDGLATGVTAKAAITSILQQNPQKLIVLVPVCSQEAVTEIKLFIRPRKDEIICLTIPDRFLSVGIWYKKFDQVSDLDVVNLLEESHKGAQTSGNVKDKPKADNFQRIRKHE